MKTIFADTFYWVALINNRDAWHEKAIEMTRKLQQVTIVTTDEVFIEVFNNKALITSSPVTTGNFGIR
nr:hypothetical protein [Microcystis aeruginosa]